MPGPEDCRACGVDAFFLKLPGVSSPGLLTRPAPTASASGRCWPLADPACAGACSAPLCISRGRLLAARPLRRARMGVGGRVCACDLGGNVLPSASGRPASRGGATRRLATAAAPPPQAPERSRGTRGTPELCRRSRVGPERGHDNAANDHRATRERERKSGGKKRKTRERERSGCVRERERCGRVAVCCGCRRVGDAGRGGLR